MPPRLGSVRQITLAGVFSRLDEQRDLVELPDAKILSAVVEYALVTKTVEDRADHATSSPHKICELLLGQAEVLPEAVLAARGKPTGQLTDRLSQTRFDTLERKALESPLEAAKPTSQFCGELQSGGRVL